MSVFEILNKVDVSEHVEKKGKFDYVSWAWAWQYTKRLFPDATYSISQNVLPNGYTVNYFTDGRTAYVETSVTIDGETQIEQLPITNNYNKPIEFEKLNSFDVNTAIKRCLTKCLALHGLGLCLWAGEDLPSDENKNAQQLDHDADIKKYAQVLANNSDKTPQEWIDAAKKKCKEPKDIALKLLQWVGDQQRKQND